MKVVNRTYSEAESLLKEGDILLFRGSGLISNLIKIAGAGQYSHVAIASRVNGYWEVVEFREWYGGRAVNLENYIKLSEKTNTQIDVYRSVDEYNTLTFNEETNEVIKTQSQFDGHKVTRCMRKLTGLPYSYKRIWLLLKIKLFKIHLLRNLEKITDDLPTKEIIYPVCSTVLAHCFSINDYDILKCKSDEWTEPTHFANSTRSNYLWTFSV